MGARFVRGESRVGTVATERTTQDRAEGVRVVIERLQHLRERRSQAASDFEAAGKELDAIRAVGAEIDADNEWRAEVAAARNSFFDARVALESLRKRLVELPPPRRRGWFRRAS